jgi:hypothetical protein
MKERSEECGERGVLASVDGEFPVKAINIGDDVVLLSWRWDRDRKTAIVSR